jgi:hypothetical protein
MYVGHLIERCCSYEAIPSVCRPKKGSRQFRVKMHAKPQLTIFQSVRGWLGALEQRTGLREIIPQLVHRICRISKGSELSAHHGLRQAEGVATEQIDMAPPQRS